MRAARPRRRLRLLLLIAFSLLPALAPVALAPRGVAAALTLTPDPPSTLLAPGATALALTVTTSAATTCRWALDAPDAGYDAMTPFAAGAGTTTHTTQVTGLSGDPRIVHDVFVRCAADPSVRLALQYRSRAEGTPSYPRVGNLWGSWGYMDEIDRNDPSRVAKIDLWLGAGFDAEQVATLRRWNPQVLILGSINAVEMTEGDDVPADYWLRDVNGNRIEVWPGAYRMNLTRPEVARFMAAYAYRQMTDSGMTYDGLFFDNVFLSQSWWNKDIYGQPFVHDANEDGRPDDPAWLDAAWREGVLLELRTFKALMPNALMSGHAQDIADPEIQGLFNATSIGFDVPYVLEGRPDGPSFAELWARYRNWQTLALPPRITMVESAVPTQLGYGYGYLPWESTPPETIAFGRDFYRYMRFGLAFTLMHDGYFAQEWGDTWHGNDWWYDELDYDLGQPLGPASFVPLVPPGRTLIVNGSFERPLDGTWGSWIDTADGAAAFIDRDDTTAANGTTSVRVDVTAATGTDWHVSVSQGGRSLTKGVAYDVTFWAKADAPRQITVFNQKDGPDWRGYGLYERVRLSTQWTQYTLSFVATETVTDALFQFAFGETTGTVWLDNVRVTTRPPDVMRRDFERGVVLLNATDQPVTIDLGPGYRRLRGSQAPRFQYIVDNAGSGFSTRGGSWSTRVVDSGEWGATGPYYHDWGPNSARGRGGEARWDLGITYAGTYSLSAWWPAAPTASGWNRAVRYEVVSGGKVVASTTVSQRTNGDRWSAIASGVRLQPGAYVRMVCPGTAVCVADAILVESAVRLNNGVSARTVTIPPMDGVILAKP